VSTDRILAVGDGSGGHYFSTTLAEHNRAVASYLQRLRERSLSQAWAEVNAEDSTAEAGTTPPATAP
jgi:hypothetical protein